MKKAMQVIDVIAFSLVLLGGLNYLMAGIFGLDLMHLMFGANISIVGRVVYSIIGLSALLLLVTIVARAVMKNKQSN